MKETLTWAAVVVAALISELTNAVTCAPHLRSLGVTHEEARYWARRTHSRDAFFAISSLMKMVEESPDDVWDLLALTRLGHLAPLDEFVDEFNQLARQTSGTADLEVLFETDLRELRTEIAAVMALGRFGSASARAWFTDLLRVPARVFALARVLQTFPGATYDVSRGFVRTRAPGVVQLHLARLRQWRDTTKSWRSLFRGSRLLTIHLIAQRLTLYPNEKGAVTTDLQSLGEWVLDQIAPRPEPDAPPAEPPPPHWIKFKATLFDALDTPPHRQRKGQFGLTAGEWIMGRLLTGALHDLLEKEIEQNLDTESSVAAQLVAASLLTTFSEGMVNLEGGARALGLLFDAMGVSFPRGTEIKAKFGERLRTALGESLREYFPLHGRGFRDGEVPEPSEPAPAMHGPRPTQVVRTAEPTDPGDDLPNFTAVEAGRTYLVQFTRPHPKFSGLQRVVFTKDALDEIANHTEVEPEVWLKALRRGVAGPYRQSGVKLTTFGTRRGACEVLPAHIKLRFSNYGVTGEFCGGTWTFTGIFKRH